MISWGYTWLAMFYAVLLLAVVIARQSFVARIMRVSGLRQMGLIAYGVFLIHPVMNALVHGILLGKGVQINNFQDAGATVIAFLATVFLAAVSWHFFEKPIIGWGHSFVYTSGNSRILPGHLSQERL